MNKLIHISVSDYIDLGGELKVGQKIFTGTDLEGWSHKYTFQELTHKGMKVVGTDTFIGTGWTYVETVISLSTGDLDDDQQEELLETLNQNVIKNYARWTLNMIPEEDVMTEDDCECDDYSLDDYDTHEMIEHLADNGYDIIQLLMIQNDIVTQTLIKEFINNFNRIPKEELQKLIDKYK
tara:strand:- start:37785 stop:38324 length:540 start_codon:yes stop_codon:yes gene_type:complete